MSRREQLHDWFNQTKEHHDSILVHILVRVCLFGILLSVVLLFMIRR